MKNHRRKMIAPIAVAALVLLYLIVYAVLVMLGAGFHPAVLLLIIPIAAVAYGIIYVMVERIHEIKEGEEDDLSNY